MCNQDKHGNRYIPNAKDYEEARILFSNSIRGDNHPNKKLENRKKLLWSEERKKRQNFSGWKMNNEGREKIKNSWTKERKLEHSKHNPANTPEALKKRKDSMFGSNNWKARKINQYTKHGEFIAQYPSIADALRACGNTLGISAVCCGRAKTAGGFIWKYAT